MNNYTIINGYRHGELLELKDAVKNDTITNVIYFPPFRKNLCKDDLPIRYSIPKFVQKFHIIGEFAFYLGESFYVSPIIEETEELISTILPEKGVSNDI